jgi:hypothetical protein
MYSLAEQRGHVPRFAQRLPIAIDTGIHRTTVEGCMCHRHMLPKHRARKQSKTRPGRSVIRSMPAMFFDRTSVILTIYTNMHMKPCSACTFMTPQPYIQTTHQAKEDKNNYTPLCSRSRLHRRLPLSGRDYIADPTNPPVCQVTHASMRPIHLPAPRSEFACLRSHTDLAIAGGMKSDQAAG